MDVVEQLEKKAKEFRIKYNEAYGEDISHGHCLERIAIMMGFRDWNTLSAIAKTDPKRIEQYLKIGSSE